VEIMDVEEILRIFGESPYTEDVGSVYEVCLNLLSL
jgi:hypothetical protein